MMDGSREVIIFASKVIFFASKAKPQTSAQQYTDNRDQWRQPVARQIDNNRTWRAKPRITTDIACVCTAESLPLVSLSKEREFRAGLRAR